MEDYATDVDYSLAFDLGLELGIFSSRPPSPRPHLTAGSQVPVSSGSPPGEVGNLSPTYRDEDPIVIDSDEELPDINDLGSRSASACRPTKLLVTY